MPPQSLVPFRPSGALTAPLSVFIYCESGSLPLARRFFSFCLSFFFLNFLHLFLCVCAHVHDTNRQQFGEVSVSFH